MTNSPSEAAPEARDGPCPERDAVTETFDIKNRGREGWRLSLTADFAYAHPETASTAYRFRREEFVEQVRLTTMSFGQGTVTFRRKTDRNVLIIPMPAMQAIRHWLGDAPFARWRMLTLQNGWFMSLIVGILFAMAKDGTAAGMAKSMSGMAIIGSAVWARYVPKRGLLLLQSLGWIGVGATFLHDVVVQGHGPWYLLILVFLPFIVLRAVALFGYFK